MRNLRIIVPSALIGLVAGAHAQFNFSSVSATYSLTPGSGTIDWIVNPDTAGMTIDFTQNAPAFKVGGSTTFSSGSSAITYNVTSPVEITSVDLTLQGDVENLGEIQYAESVASGSSNLGSISGLIQGASYAGGVNGAFTDVLHLGFSQPVTSFSVTQTLASDLNGQSAPSSSVALAGTVEQNFNAAVPEPASLAGLALGAAAFVKRRKR